MLTCSQDMFFKNDVSQHQPSSRDVMAFGSIHKSSTMSSISGYYSNEYHSKEKYPKQPQKDYLMSHNPSLSNGKDKEEQVWPVDVESAFIEALETIPKLGRRKILVNGKPCGRNELISDFIFRKTSKIRTRKQVSSHIQVLKNTRKGDPHFMRLLTDSTDMKPREGFLQKKMPVLHHPNVFLKGLPANTVASLHHPTMFSASELNLNSAPTNTNISINTAISSSSSSSTSSDESSTGSSPSPADYVFDLMYGADPSLSQNPLSLLDIKDLYSPLQQQNLFGIVDPLATHQHQQQQQQQQLLQQTMSTGNTPFFGTDTANYGMSAFSSPTGLSSAYTFHGINPYTSANTGMFSNTALSSDNDISITNNTNTTTKTNDTIITPNDNNNTNNPATSEATEDIVMTVSGNTTTSTNISAGASADLNTTNTVSLLSMEDITCASSHSEPCLSATGSSYTTTLQKANAIRRKSCMKDIQGPTFALWPNYLCLFLEYALPYDTSMTVSHNLAQLPHCYPNCLSTVKTTTVSRDKCPLVETLTFHPTNVVLLAKMKLDLNLNISDFVFNNTFFFEARDRRTIECTTTIYSFGNVVLESKEIQQALWLNEDRYMYSFVYVNQFFDAFMKGIRSLQSWNEVDIAIQNLCIVQVFEDIETKYNSTAPGTMDPSLVENLASPENSAGVAARSRPNLLSMIYEFERGHGTIDMSAIGDAATNEKFGIGRGMDLMEGISMDC
ncbi:TEA/ATTS domain family-domain-containing protein [Spinellus fusiger]|nr:TEA/ATTS domain family-domain-containing protein [Spinellus fusiger]